MPKETDKLRAYWSKKEGDLMLFHPLGINTKSDAHYLSVLLEEVPEELERRGYDKTTFRLSISPKIGNERFASQRRKAP